MAGAGRALSLGHVATLADMAVDLGAISTQSTRFRGRTRIVRARLESRRNQHEQHQAASRGTLQT